MKLKRYRGFYIFVAILAVGIIVLILAGTTGNSDAPQRSPQATAAHSYKDEPVYRAPASEDVGPATGSNANATSVSITASLAAALRDWKSEWLQTRRVPGATRIANLCSQRGLVQGSYAQRVDQACADFNKAMEYGSIGNETKVLEMVNQAINDLP